MPTIDILGVSHAYDLTEPRVTGEVLVFIHGWLLSRSYWQPLVDLLSPDYQCLCYDLRGFGGSQQGCDRPDISSGYSLAAYANDLVLLLKQLEIKRAWLVGHSLGGSIALWAADQFPQVIQGVVCLNAGGGIYLKEEFERFRSAGQQLVKFRRRWFSYIPMLDLLFTRASVEQPLMRKWGRQRLVDFITAHPDAALGALLESTTESKVHLLPQIVARLQQPVFFIAGAQDPIMEPKYVKHLASFHASFQGNCANVIEIPDCGHMAMLEQPQKVGKEICQIVSRDRR